MNFESGQKTKFSKLFQKKFKNYENTQFLIEIFYRTIDKKMPQKMPEIFTKFDVKFIN